MADLARARDSPTVEQRPQSAEARDIEHPILQLQHLAGNRAVAGLFGGPTIQRHPEPSSNAEVGEPETAPGTAPGAATGGPTGTPATGPAGGEASQPVGGGTGTTGTTGGALTGQARIKAISDALNASSTGQWAMSILGKWKIPVDWEFGGTGSFHQGGKIFLNKTLGVGGAALVMMHEAQHANTYKSGTQADPNKMGRAEWVKAMIADEAEAVVRQFEGMAVTKGLGVDMAGAGVNDALKERYLKAFNEKRDALEKATPGMSRAEINAQARTFARDGEVTKMFSDGTFVTSTNNNSYVIFYGLQWDQLTKPPAK